MNRTAEGKLKHTRIGFIPEDWETSELGSVAEIIGGGTPSTSVKEYWDPPEIEWVTAKDISNSQTARVQTTEKRISKLGLENSSAKMLPTSATVVIARGATMGQCRMLSREMAMNQTCYGIIAKDAINPAYLYYQLSNLYKRFRASAHGSIFDTVITSGLRSIEIPIPPYEEQRSIAKILYDLDARVELNFQINKTLEAIGKALFKHWFIDFEFPNDEGNSYKSSGGEIVHSELGEIPDGWGVASLDQIAEFTRGFSYSGSEKSKLDGEYAFVTLNSVKEGGGFKREFSFITTDRAKDKHFVRRGEIVIANTEQTKTGTLLGCPALVELPSGYEKGKAIFSHHITRVRTRSPNLRYYLYYHLLAQQHSAVKYNTGSVIWALDVNNWAKNEKILVPPEPLLREFQTLADKTFVKSELDNQHTETLSNVRDSLLPKLMSGKIRAPIQVR
jgi:type I restriction enzyme, S subunit